MTFNWINKYKVDGKRFGVRISSGSAMSPKQAVLHQYDGTEWNELDRKPLKQINGYEHGKHGPLFAQRWAKDQIEWYT